MDFTFTEEQEMLRKTVRRLMLEKVAPRAAEIDQKGEFPWDVKELFAENGIFAVVVPEEYGGIDGKLLTQCIVIEEVARVCGSSSMILGNQSLGSISLAAYGTPEQKEKYLPKIATGEILPSFALTEPNAGSDVASLRTTAEPDGDDYVINGSKIFITQGAVADLLTVFAKVPMGDKKKITAFLVEAKTPGVSVPKVEEKMGLHGSPTSQIMFDNVRVPKENILGGLGNGFRIALESLDKGRISVAAQAIGLAQGALDYAKEYAKTRVQFGKPIIEHQGIQFMLAEMETDVQSARYFNYAAAWKYDTKQPDYIKFSAMTKLYATEMVRRVTTNAIQILGGYGYTRDYPVERIHRDAMIFGIFEGTNQIQKMVIARALMEE